MTEVGGSGGRARLCYWCGTLRAAGSTPTQRPGNRRSPLCRPLPGPVAAPDRTSRTQSEADPTAGRGEGRTAASRGACRPQPTLPFPPPGPPRGRDLPHRPKLSPDLRVSDEPLPAGQRPGNPDFSQRHGQSPPPFTKQIGSLPRDDSLRFLPGGSHKSPPLRGTRSYRKLAPSAGPPGGRTLGTERGAGQRESGTRSSGERRDLRAPQCGSPSSGEAHQDRTGARSRAKRATAVPTPGTTYHAPPDSLHWRASPALGEVPRKPP